jgi:hypothetical protein
MAAAKGFTTTCYEWRHRPLPGKKNCPVLNQVKCLRPDRTGRANAGGRRMTRQKIWSLRKQGEKPRI